jgi:hypothetical protein
MTHDELLALLNTKSDSDEVHALRAVVELHRSDFGTPGEDVVCDWCKVVYPCPTIQAIEKELR